MIRSHWLRTVVDILAVIGFFLSLFIAIRIFPNTDNTSFDYQAVLVGIIGGVFTLIVGWNIYQAVDWKSKIDNIIKLKAEIEREFNFIHNKTDYNHGLTYAYLSQTSASILSNERNEILAETMLRNGILAVKIFANFPNCDIEIDSVLNPIICILESNHPKFSREFITEMLLSIGEINRHDKYISLTRLIRLLEDVE